MIECGFVFRDRFKCQPIMNKKYLYQCVNYIHMNPVKASIVDKCSDYQYTSYNDFLNGKFLTGNDREMRIDLNATKDVEWSSDFFDVDYNKEKVINEYVESFCNQYNADIENVKKDKVKREELIKVLLQSGNLSKKDIEKYLNISYWMITKAIDKN